jgi:hypothetical protein
MFNDLYYGVLALFQNKQALLYFSQKKEAKQLYTFIDSEQHGIVKSYLESLIQSNENSNKPFYIQPFHEKLTHKHPLILALTHLNQENFVLFCELLAPQTQIFDSDFMVLLLGELASMEEHPIENLLYKDDPKRLKRAIKSYNLKYLVDNYLLFHLDKFNLDLTFQSQTEMKNKLPKTHFIEKVFSFFGENINQENKQHMIENYSIIVSLLEKLVKFNQHPTDLKSQFLEKEKSKKNESDNLQSLYHLILSNKRQFNSAEYFRLSEIIELINRTHDSSIQANTLHIEQEFYLKKVIDCYLPDLINTYLKISDDIKYVQKEGKENSPSTTFNLALEDIMLELSSFNEKKEENKVFDLEQKQNFLRQKTLSLKA